MSALRAISPENTTPSIQGEQEQQQTQSFYADIADVQDFVDHAPDKVLPCRERTRHAYPRLPRTGWVPDQITPRGRLIRYTEPCADCGLVRQVQVFAPRMVKRGRHWEVEGVEWLRSYPDYLEGPKGETYRVRGFGMMRPRDIRSAIASSSIDNAEGAAMLAAAVEAQKEWDRTHPKAKED
jgi:hypothetical protein